MIKIWFIGKNDNKVIYFFTFLQIAFFQKWNECPLSWHNIRKFMFILSKFVNTHSFNGKVSTNDGDTKKRRPNPYLLTGLARPHITYG